MKRIVSGIMLTLLLIGMLTLAFQIQPVKAGTITVPDDYPTIQQAINNASEGDTIYVHSGYYAEDVVVDKPVSLIGVYFPALRSFKVVANNVYIGGFCLQNPGVFPYGRAIVLDGVKGCIVSGVIVNGVDEGSGIVLEDASNNIIANCTVWGLPWGGCIQLVGSSNNTIFSNTIDASYGPCIYLENSSDNDIFHNNFYVYYAQQVEIRGISINVWDDGYPSGGNYWSDHNPPDENKDKIGDSPYVIDVNNTDRYPLIYPFEFYQPGYVPKSDINKDGIVNIIDVAIVARAYGCKPGDSNWNPVADMVINETINIMDIATVAKDYGKTT